MRKRVPTSVYPKKSDRAKADEIAEAEDLHVSQVFLKAFRAYARRWDRRREAARLGHGGRLARA